ncbi:hypothetical protein [Prevotella sp.]|uniref:hypothetical protein n=1 Tax=Prevotella sp. TaxID=59823 RepID=UPI0027E22879|nr:hypothetical protein [Prevotella sp.]
MKILPFISTIDMLSYGNAMQVRTGQTLVAENISYHSYDPMMQLAFKTPVEKMIVVYVGLKIEKCILFVNFTYAYNAVVEHYSKMVNPLDLMKREMPKFSEVYMQNEPNTQLSTLFFKKEDDCVLLVKQGPAYLLETSEDLEMGTLGMIRNFARVILEDIYNANVLDSCAMAKISSDIAVIKTFISE